MKSIRAKITAITVGVIVAAMLIAAALGVVAIRTVGNREAEQTLFLLCETGQKNLNHYFESVEQSVEMLSAYVRSDLDGLEENQLQAHLDRVSQIFQQLTYKTHGVLTYYYRIDPEISQSVKGFWYVNLDGTGFQKHEVTDISIYNTRDTSQLVWFTVPKANGSTIWLPPYITDTLNVRVLSYNVPVYYGEQFVGVIGIEIDFAVITDILEHITLYDNGYAFLLDRDGTVVYHPRVNVMSMGTRPTAPDSLMSGESLVRYTFGGVEKKAVSLPLSNGMRLIVTVPVEEIDAGWQGWSVEIVVAFALLLVVFAFLIKALVGKIISPLRRLTEAAEQISQGNYNYELEYDQEDEIGVLTRSFQKVTANLKTYISELNELALVDALTGIRNRMALHHDFNAVDAHKVTVLMLDVNDFKRVNDTRGHEEGDRILRQTGQVLSDVFGGAHCYRYGGDEFVVVIPELSETALRQRLGRLEESRPKVDDSTPVEYSIGVAHGMLDGPDSLQTLISAADLRMYEAKRDKKKSTLPKEGAAESRLKTSEYTVKELKDFLAEMSRKYDLARVVDPIECRIIQLQDDGKVSMNESCYGIWNSEQKCINCSSAMACRTGCHQEKAEHFQDNFYFIQSNPVKLRLPNGNLFDAVVELVNVKEEMEGEVNNREAENKGARAANYRAHHDSLTNVLNADAFYQLSRDMLRNSGEKSWVMVTGNVKDFRLINTMFGILRGNEVLVRTGALLREISEEAMGLCGRLGGDQFALLLPRESYREEALMQVSQKLKAVFNSGTYTFCIHFGVYEIEEPSIPVSVMCGRANSALYTIREDVTQVVAWFNEDIRQKLLLDQAVIGGFEEAKKTGQIQMYLQPLVGKEGQVVGAEALARWRRPDGSMIMPGDFIETLENAGMIQKLDLYMWELAAQRLSKWKKAGKTDLFISVNVSPKDFYSMDVVETLTGLVQKYDVDSRLLRLEITETAFLGDPERNNAVLHQLRQQGFLVEIDDFGKGNSSLSLLKDISADVLKIDMGFLQEIKDKERSRIILKSVIGMADSLGMEVITEGVETERQLQALLEMGCTHFQGYYFSRPIPEEEFEAKYGPAS